MKIGFIGAGNLAQTYGDDTNAKQKLARALEETVFVPVDLGGLIEGGKLQEFGCPLSGLHLDLIKRMEF